MKAFLTSLFQKSKSEEEVLDPKLAATLDFFYRAKTDDLKKLAAELHEKHVALAKQIHAVLKKTYSSKKSGEKSDGDEPSVALSNEIVPVDTNAQETVLGESVETKDDSTLRTPFDLEGYARILQNAFESKNGKKQALAFFKGPSENDSKRNNLSFQIFFTYLDEKINPKKVSFNSLFRYADFWDLLLMRIGILFSIPGGLFMPFFAIIVGDTVNQLHMAANIRKMNSTLGGEILTLAEATKGAPMNLNFQTFFVLAAVSLLTSFVDQAAWNITAARQAFRLRQAYAAAILSQDCAFFELRENTAGALCNTMESSVANVEKGLGKQYTTILRGGLSLISGFFVAFIVSPSLAAVSLAVIPMFLVVNVPLFAMLSNVHKQFEAIYRDAFSVITEYLGTMRTVASLGAEDTGATKVAEILKDTIPKSTNVQTKLGGSFGFFGLMIYSVYAWCMYFGGSFIVADRQNVPHCALNLTYSNITSNETIGISISQSILLGRPNEPRCFRGGDVLVVFFAILMGAFGLMGAFPALTTLEEARASAYQIYKVIDRKSPISLNDENETDDNKASKKKQMNKVDQKKEQQDTDGKTSAASGDIEFRNVSFAYASRPQNKVLDDFNLRIPEGATVALVGPSGCGKSTLVSLLERFYDPTDGEILINNVNLAKDINLTEYRSKVAYVEQEPRLFNLTIRENIAMGKTLNHHQLDAKVVDQKDQVHHEQNNEAVTLEEVIEAAKAANAHHFIKAFEKGYETDCGAAGGRLSGGQKQRIAIARCLLRKPSILLLDEATSALDLQSEKVVQDTIDSLIENQVLAKKKVTTIIIAHRLSTIRNANMIVVMNKGKVVEKGTHDELVALGPEQGFYASMVAHQGVEKNSDDSDATQGNNLFRDKNVLDTADASSSYSRSLSFEKHSRSLSYDKKDDIPSILSHDSKNGDFMNDDLGLSGKVTKKALTKEEKQKLKEKRKSSLRRLYRIVWPYRFYVLVGFLTSAFLGGNQPIFALLLGWILDTYNLEDNTQLMHQASLIALFFVIMGIISIAGRVLNAYVYSVVRTNVITVVRTELFRCILQQNIGWFESKKENSSGNVILLLGKELAEIRHLIGDMASQKIECFFSASVGIGIAMWASWKLTLVICACSPVMVIGTALRHGSWAKDQGWKRKRGEELNDDSTDIFLESVYLFRTVAAFDLKDSRMKVFYERSLISWADKFKKALMDAAGFAFASGSNFIVYGVAFWYAGYLNEVEGLGVLQIFTCFFAIVVGAGAVGRAGQTIVENEKKALEVLDRVYGIMDREIPISDKACERAFGHEARSIEMSANTDGAQPLLEFKDVTFAYPTRKNTKVLDQFNLKIRRGEVVALVGESGCGKSTMFALIQRFYDPGMITHGTGHNKGELSDVTIEVKETETKDAKEDVKSENDDAGLGSGCILLNGNDIKSLKLQELRRTCALVEQQPNVFDDTIRNNILLGYSEDTTSKEVEDELVKAARMANCHKFIMEFDNQYETRIGSSASALLSGGQKQRVCIARALVRKPQILLLDEATSALDAKSQTVVQDAIDSLIYDKTKAVTALIIAHRLTTIQKADRIVVLKNGKVFEEGKHDDLIAKKGLYKKLWDLQVQK
eukprot:g3354.t1